MTIQARFLYGSTLARAWRLSKGPKTIDGDSLFPLNSINLDSIFTLAQFLSPRYSGPKIVQLSSPLHPGIGFYTLAFWGPVLTVEWLLEARQWNIRRQTIWGQSLKDPLWGPWSIQQSSFHQLEYMYTVTEGTCLAVWRHIVSDNPISINNTCIDGRIR